MRVLNDNLKDDKIRLSYLGTFDDSITDKLIGISEFYIENRTDLGKLKNKVSFLIAECFQNIVRHGGAKETPKISHPGHSDFFQINILDNQALLSSCNLIKESKGKVLEQKLKHVNSLNQDELKTLYQSLLTGGFTEKGGAGLGLIEMARKSGLPLKYIFKNLEGEINQFFLSLEILNKKDNAEEKLKIETIEEFYRYLFAEKIIMFYKGDLSKDILGPIINMLQHNFEDEQNLSGKEKRTVITLIEALQNISKHAKSINGIKEGVFAIVKTSNGYSMEVGNFIEENDHHEFNNHLASIGKMSMEEITTLYKKRLLESQISPEGNCGLGLLEIAKNSNKNYTYSFTPDSQNDLFYSLKITI